MDAQFQAPSQHLDTATISLNRLLSRLEDVLLSPESSAALRSSSLERARIGAVCGCAGMIVITAANETLTERRICENVTAQLRALCRYIDSAQSKEDRTTE